MIDLNIKDVMKNHPDGEKIDQHLDGGGMLSRQQRRALIKITVSSLVEKCGL